MKEVGVLGINGEKVKTINLNPEVFDAELNDHAEYLYIKSYLANQRQGTHKAKQRGEVAGSTRKLHRQKGTGGSRKGDIKNPLYKGGGRVFGPLPRDYSIKVNRKVKDIARRSALSRKSASESIFVVQDINLESCKTKALLNIVNNIGIAGKSKMLFVLSDVKKEFYLASRNVPYINISSYNSLNAYSIAVSDKIIFEESSLSKFEELVLKSNS